MSVRHLTEVRDVTIVIRGAPMPIDAYKAVNTKVEQLESQYLNSLDEDGVSQNLVDLAAAKSVITGATPFKVYVFDLTTDFAAGTYTFAYGETAPNVETATTL